MDKTDILYGLGWYFVFVISVTFHEAAHAWAAKKGGDLTAYAGGQVSLNPWPHMKREPLGMVVIPLISAFLIGWPFGYAKTPFNAAWAHDHPRKAAWMSAAGPAANLLLFLLAVLIIKGGIWASIFAEPYSVNFHHMVDPAVGDKTNGLVIFISMLFSMNLILLVLNIIPLPPLDGSGMIALFLSDDAARKYQSVISNPAFAFIGLLLAWQAFTPLFEFIFIRVINIVYWGAGFS
jgi:Zn-dependent protease